MRNCTLCTLVYASNDLNRNLEKALSCGFRDINAFCHVANCPARELKRFCSRILQALDTRSKVSHEVLGQLAYADDNLLELGLELQALPLRLQPGDLCIQVWIHCLRAPLNSVGDIQYPAFDRCELLLGALDLLQCPGPIRKIDHGRAHALRRSSGKADCLLKPSREHQRRHNNIFQLGHDLKAMLLRFQPGDLCFQTWMNCLSVSLHSVDNIQYTLFDSCKLLLGRLELRKCSSLIMNINRGHGDALRCSSGDADCILQ
mmetsp:Transcript_45507/g.97293  ORF Transcript_45507/g.97293 Transcript_45507/m.97293 type:complete len:260 (-) Transcript_45507:413-1192(-)